LYVVQLILGRSKLLLPPPPVLLLQLQLQQ
jgi:hypothetical protein